MLQCSLILDSDSHRAEDDRQNTASNNECTIVFELKPVYSVNQKVVKITSYLWGELTIFYISHLYGFSSVTKEHNPLIVYL